MKRILLLTMCMVALCCINLVAQNDGVCVPATTIDEVVDPGQATVCDDGSNVPALTLPMSSLPDVEFVVEVNDSIVDINADGTIDPALLITGGELCATAFTYDLAEINVILDKANGLCPILDCDGLIGFVGANELIADLVNGVNDGVPGLNDLQEALNFAAVFGAIASVEDADTALVSVNTQVGGFVGNICFATSAPICYTIETCLCLDCDDVACDKITRPCDDGDDCTINDMETVLGDDESIACVPCAGDAGLEGCTDATACNYDPAATCDDGSCDFGNDDCHDKCNAVLGCTDPYACNYDPSTTCDDGSCEFTSCAGCIDPTACNFDATAMIDDGSCIVPDGCTDATACNYDAVATCDDGSCDFGDAACPEPCDVILGCTSATACNYDAVATCDDASCEEPNGCTDSAALNYDPTATCDNGYCEYEFEPCPDDISIGLIERDGAFYVIPDWNPSGMETYTWYDAAGNVVGHFSGNAYFSPLATGEYTCIVYDPANDCTQEFGPRLASETNGCCELESDK